MRRANGNAHKQYAAHVCRYPPFRPPSAAVLDPVPNLRINSLCAVGLSTLVTVHRTGVRLYRERQLISPSAASPAASVNGAATALSYLTGWPISDAAAPSQPAPTRGAASASAAAAATGVFELTEARHEFQVRESYLCAAMQPVLVNGAVLLSKWSRYFAVASGSDRVVHGVSVMSSGAHFCLNHTEHQTNKVVCLQCTHVALEPFHPLSLTPAVVSVDEVGGVVLFDVEREAAAKLEQAPLWYRQRDARLAAQGPPLQTTAPPAPHPQTSLLEQHLTPEEEDHVLDAMEKASTGERVAYHLEHGVATRVALVGPCLELCNRCHNAFSRPTSDSRGYKLVSLYLCSRARDVPAAEAAPSAVAQTGSSGVPEGVGGAAELNVVLLRVLWGPRRAFVMEEVRLVHEVAPTDVCDVGVAMSARPYQVGVPMTLHLARPALELWRLCGCTGELLETRRLYPRAEDGRGAVRRAARRAAADFFVHWVPLGRHRLAVEGGSDEGGAAPLSWFCTAAVTDDDTVLLLGSAPQPARSLRAREKASAVVAAAPALPHVAARSPTGEDIASAASAAPFTDANLEAWLDDISTPGSRCSSPGPARSGSTSRATRSANNSSAVAAAAAAATPADEEGTQTGCAPEEMPAGLTAVLTPPPAASAPYTVLMELYAAHRADGSRNLDGASPAATGVRAVLPDWTANRLLLFTTDQEALLSVPLPFPERIGTVTDLKSATEGMGRVGGRQDASRAPDPAAAVPATVTQGFNKAVAAPMPTDAAESAQATHQASQPRWWGPTSRAASSESHGWASAIPHWPSSAASYLSYFDTTGGAGAPKATPNGPLPCLQAPETARPSASKPPSPAPAPPPPAPSAFRHFSITRPLMAAVFYVTGEDAEEPLPPRPRLPAPSPSLPQEGTVAASSAVACTAPEAPMPAPRSDASDALATPPAGSSPRAGSAAERRSGSATASVALAVPIRVASSAPHGEAETGSASEGGSRASSHRRRSRHHHHRRSDSAAGAASRDGSPSRSESGGAVASSRQRRTGRLPRAVSNIAVEAAAPGPGAAHTEGIAEAGAEAAAVRASYLATQMALLRGDMQQQQPAGRGAGGGAPQPHFALRHLVEVGEPLERNTLVYSWRDVHNDLYIDFSAALDELRQREEAAEEEDDGGTQRRRSGSLSARTQDGAVSPGSTRRGRRSARRPRLVLHRPADVEAGVHSMGFFPHYNAVVARRVATASYGTCFDFSSYFQSMQVPQHVLDVQERDKCRLELEDLRLQQAKDLASVCPFEQMAIFQNEERASGREAGWRLHATFPYDDASDGHLVDIVQLNRTAGSSAAAAPEYRWADAAEAKAWAEEHGTAHGSAPRVKSLVKELKDWEFSSWGYATRWPTPEEEKGGVDAFVWSSVEQPEHLCRRRRLHRLRVHVAELRRQTELMAAHQRELNGLREELGL